MKSFYPLKVLASICAALPFAFLASGPAASWEPTKSVTLVVPFNAGGGSDTFARMLAKLASEKGFSPVPWVVVNRAGGSGMVGLEYVVNQQGASDTLFLSGISAVAIPQLQKLPISWKKLTPIANLSTEPQVLITHDKSGYSTLENFLKAARVEERAVTIGGGAIGQDDHITNLMLEDAAKIKTRYVAFNGGAEVRQNIMGGHIDAAWMNPAEYEGALKSQGGNLVPLAVALDTRATGLPDIPTFKELGLASVNYTMLFRGVWAPGGVSDEVRDYYIGTLSKVTETDEWKKFMQSQKLDVEFTPGDQFHRALTKMDQQIEALLPAIKAAN